MINRAKLSSGNADVVFYADYYPFGTVVRSGGTGWRYGYQGENAEKDNETGWNSFELRNYDAAIGRWLSTDPYGQYASPYVGMGNNPVMMADVDGGWADGGDDPVKISWKDYKEGQVIALDPVFVSAYYGGSIRAFTPDFWDNWASSKNWFSKITYNIADPFVVYGTSFFGDPMHIGGGRANRKELTEAGGAAITSAVPLEAAFAKGGMFVKGVAKTGVEVIEQAAVHGNSLKSLKPTWGYKLYSNDGTFLKNGITSKLVPESRYTKSFMSDKYMVPVKQFPNRKAAWNWEFGQNQILRGPLNKNMH